MNTIKAALIFPFFAFIWSFSIQSKEFTLDAKNWCKWKGVPYSKWNACVFFASDRAFRNLFYYRAGPIHNIISCLYPGYDHLQITTPRGSIKGGVIFQHGFSTIVSAAKIGKNCKIYQQVTIGYNHKLEAPTIGDNVEICCGAKVIGGVRIGNNVMIGANAVVINDIPDNSIVAGIPAKIIGQLSVNADIFHRKNKDV